ncbi:glucan biosynthesis protein D [Chelatococcus sp.]|uniref:glucan biosynthesis protein n=1 Tax=Chelatococcus sp. TaxID=1953771 RepID=UPI0025C529B4|nr:glucan biosynthesis protein D [Chelatococcus sp.]
MPLLNRRMLGQIMVAGFAAQALGTGGLSTAAMAQQAGGLKFGRSRAFSYDWLRKHAAELAAKPYQSPPRPDPAIVSKIDYDAHGKLKYKTDFALFADGKSPFPITFMHVGQFFPKTVQMFAVASGKAREILYQPDYFTMGTGHIAQKLAAQPSAFAGFWVREPGKDWADKEPWATFLGASYFRGVGELGQVGLSARGIAVTPGAGVPEEFPDFTAFWFVPSPADSDSVTVYALLDGPSLTGAYRFVMHRTRGVVMDIDARLFLRQPITRIGIAPLTSMYWFSETAKAAGVDWRPEVHDSDGLAIWTGSGERIWRPLNNPSSIMTSSFLDDSPRGFGLMQRDRDFDNYQDGVRYQLRPSAWVEPKGKWGKGSVQLIELPTDDEIHDNIVAYWNPAKPTKAGDELDFAYSLHWLADEPTPSPLARCVATRLSGANTPGQQRPDGVRRFMVEFSGEPLATLPPNVAPEPVLWASRGEFSRAFTQRVPGDNPARWRAQFDLAVDGKGPVDMRLFLRSGDTILSETWLYQYHPF